MDEFGERVLFVHAHPDDEVLSTGAAIAAIAHDGGVPGVLTLTAGGAGEIRPEAVPALAAAGEITRLRSDELDASLLALGALRIEPQVLYADSGMEWGSDGRAVATDTLVPNALTRQPLEDIEAVIVAAVREFAPTAIVTYDSDGGYGHPDHAVTHKAAREAALRFGIPLYVRTATPADIEIDGRQHRDVVLCALAAHQSQLRVDGDQVVHVGGQREAIDDVEHYLAVQEDPDPIGAFSYLMLGLIGLVVGVVGTFAHQSLPPVGVILALVAAFGVLAGPRLITGRRSASVASAVGLVGAIAVLALDPLGKLQLIAGDRDGFLWGIVPVVAAVATIAWPDAKRSSRASVGNRLESREGASR